MKITLELDEKQVLKLISGQAFAVTFLAKLGADTMAKSHSELCEVISEQFAEQMGASLAAEIAEALK